MMLMWLRYEARTADVSSQVPSQHTVAGFQVVPFNSPLSLSHCGGDFLNCSSILFMLSHPQQWLAPWPKPPQICCHRRCHSFVTSICHGSVLSALLSLSGHHGSHQSLKFSSYIGVVPITWGILRPDLPTCTVPVSQVWLNSWVVVESHTSLRPVQIQRCHSRRIESMTESDRNVPIRLRGTHTQPEASEILFTPGPTRAWQSLS